MPESVEFATSKEEIDADYRRRMCRAAKLNRGTHTSARVHIAAADVEAGKQGGVTVKQPCVHHDQSVAVAAARGEFDGTDDAVSESDGSSVVLGPNKHYVPVVELLRNYWPGLLLQTGYEACECREREACTQ
jgi:hypothetical protein